MLPPDITITKQVEDSRYEKDLSRSTFIRVEFYVGKHGPFVERFPKETFTADVRDAKLSAWADQVRT